MRRARKTRQPRQQRAPPRPGLRRRRRLRQRRPRAPIPRRIRASPSPRAPWATHPTCRGKPRFPAWIASDAPLAALMSTAPDDTPQESFISHLIELRTRLIRSIVAVVLVLL